MVRVHVRKNHLKRAQLGLLEVGQVKAHVYHGLGPSEISRVIVKPDGKSHYTPTAIADCIAKLQANPKWRGERQAGSGPPRKTTKRQDDALVKKLIGCRVAVKVTVGYLRTCFKWAQHMSDTALEERLRDAGLV